MEQVNWEFYGKLATILGIICWKTPLKFLWKEEPPHCFKDKCEECTKQLGDKI